MDELLKIHSNISLLIGNWDAIIKKFILSQESLFIDTVHDQLSRGKGGDGKNLESYSSDDYAKFKKALGSLSSPIADLKLSGDFYEGMVMNDDFVIFSKDWKNETLHKIYGDDITEVDSNNMAKIIRDQILPEFEDYVYKMIFK